MYRSLRAAYEGERVLASVAAVHVIIDRAIKASLDTDPWVVASTVSSIAVALITGLLAWSTRNLSISTKALAQKTAELATDTVDATNLADRHHRKGLTPIVSIIGTFSIIVPQGEHTGECCMVFKGKLYNGGLGPALGIAVSGLTVGGWFTPEQFTVRNVLGPGASASLEKIWTLKNGHHGSKLGTPLPYEFTLIYINVFAEGVTTKQYSPTGNIDDENIAVEQPNFL